MTEHDYLRRRIVLSADLSPVGHIPESKAKQRLEKFFGPRSVLPWLLKEAKARKLMGVYRYENPDNTGITYDDLARLGVEKSYIERLLEKVRLYEQSGNREFLVDAFNYVLLELQTPMHEQSHFNSQERYDD